MGPMYEIIKDQFKSGRSLTQNKFFGLVNKGLWPKHIWDLYPLCQEYYHELNPYFLFNYYRPDFYKFTKLITVRDGLVNFANYVLNNVTDLPKFGLYHLVHPDLAPLVPPNRVDYFHCWQLSHPKKMELHEAKKVIVFGHLTKTYLGELEDLEDRLAPLRDLPAGTEIELFLPLRREPFQLPGQDKESVLCHQAIDVVRTLLPDKKLEFITGEQFFDKSDFNGTYLFDLAPDRFVVSDNYLHYYVCSRGGSVNLVPKEAPKNSLFELDVSLHHKLHVTPLPKCKSFFVDLLFYKKQFSSKDITYDPVFHNTLRASLTSKA